MALVAVAAPTACGSSDASPKTFGDVSAGNKSALAVGAISAIPDAPAFICRDDKGIYAMTSTCTHQACDLKDGTVSGGTITCSCHGSKFDATGNATHGPASGALQHFAVTIDGSGAITVHGGQEVASDVRVAA